MEQRAGKIAPSPTCFHQASSRRCLRGTRPDTDPKPPTPKQEPEGVLRHFARARGRARGGLRLVPGARERHIGAAAGCGSGAAALGVGGRLRVRGRGWRARRPRAAGFAGHERCPRRRPIPSQDAHGRCRPRARPVGHAIAWKSPVVRAVRSPGIAASGRSTDRWLPACPGSSAGSFRVKSRLIRLRAVGSEIDRQGAAPSPRPRTCRGIWYLHRHEPRSGNRGHLRNHLADGSTTPCPRGRLTALAAHPRGASSGGPDPSVWVPLGGLALAALPWTSRGRTALTTTRMPLTITRGSLSAAAARVRACMRLHLGARPRSRTPLRRQRRRADRTQKARLFIDLKLGSPYPTAPSNGTPIKKADIEIGL